MENVLEIRNLTKSYDKFKLDDINIDLPKGEIIGLIGENGAGKTTLIKSILNIIKVDKGEIKIFNKDYLKEERKIKDEVGIVLDNVFFPEILTAKDINLTMKDTFKKWDSDMYYNYLKTFDIPLNKKIKELSKGMRKKLEIATALSHKPKLLILDEPTNGLDPVIRNEVLDIFLDFIQDEEHTILLSTHITTDLEHIADRILLMDEGHIVMNENKDILLDDYGILKCDSGTFNAIDNKDIISYKKNKYGYHVLISNKNELKNKYKTSVIDKITLDDLMLLMIKGEK